jgi:hypothetical protein
LKYFFRDLVWIDRSLLLGRFEINRRVEIHKLKQQVKFYPRVSANPPLNNRPLTSFISFGVPSKFSIIFALFYKWKSKHTFIGLYRFVFTLRNVWKMYIYEISMICTLFWTFIIHPLVHIHQKKIALELKPGWNEDESTLS